MEGYVKLHRAILQWEWYKDQNTKCLFIHLLLKACFDECHHKGSIVGRGQIVTSLSKLSEQTGLSTRQVRTSLDKLQRSSEITIDTNNKHTVITVCKYEDYQLAEDQAFEVPANNVNYASAIDLHVDRATSMKDLRDFSKICANDQIWLDSICMMHKATPESVKSALKTFDLHLKTIGDTKSNMRDYKSHFVNWLRYNKSELKIRQHLYKWKWKGQAVKTGTYQEMVVDQQNFDSPGFDFTILQGT